MRRSRSIWIGWDFRSQYGRLNLIANNSRFLILPGRRLRLCWPAIWLVRLAVAAAWPTVAALLADDLACAATGAQLLFP